MADRITFGAKGMAIFNYTVGSSGVPTYAATPILWGGLKGATFKPKSESEQVYADDVVWATIQGASGGDFETTHLAVPLNVMQAVFGVAVDSKKARIIGAGSNKSVGIVIESQVMDENGAISPELHVFYSVTFSEPELNIETREDKTKPQEYKSTGTATAVQFPGIPQAISRVVLRKSEMLAADYDKAKTTMYIPTSVVVGG